MKKSTLIFICIVLLLTCSCAPAIKNLDSEGTEIVCFGNSITYGSGVARGEDYPSRLSELIGVEVINAGAGGDTTESALRRLESDVLDWDPYLVIVELGANDYLQDLPKEKSLENLRKIISSIQEEGSMVALCDVSGGPSILGAYNVHHKELKKLAAETGSIFIPHVMKGIIRNAALKSDRLHPNEKGYEIIAERVYNTIKPYLR
jgi:acyl-CoA thioesterase-1